jgi:hypothetical protein
LIRVYVTLQATDRCIQFFLLLVVIGIVVLVVLKVVGVGDVKV